MRSWGENRLFGAKKNLFGAKRKYDFIKVCEVHNDELCI